MKNIFGLLVLTSMLSVSGYAADIEEHSEKESRFYIATKALVTLGDTIEEENSKLEGSTGAGIGIDLGYKIGNGFSVEVDVTYATNTVTEILSSGEKEDFTGTYITSSLDIAYAYELTHTLEIFGKVGYEIEYEKIDTLTDSYESNTGFIYAVGVEYEVSESLALLGEFEATTIDGPRGNSIFAGIVYKF